MRKLPTTLPERVYTVINARAAPPDTTTEVLGCRGVGRQAGTKQQHGTHLHCPDQWQRKGCGFFDQPRVRLPPRRADHALARTGGQWQIRVCALAGRALVRALEERLRNVAVWADRLKAAIDDIGGRFVAAEASVGDGRADGDDVAPHGVRAIRGARRTTDLLGLAADRAAVAATRRVGRATTHRGGATRTHAFATDALIRRRAAGGIAAGNLAREAFAFARAIDAVFLVLTTRAAAAVSITATAIRAEGLVGVATGGIGMTLALADEPRAAAFQGAGAPRCCKQQRFPSHFSMQT